MTDKLAVHFQKHDKDSIAIVNESYLKTGQPSIVKILNAPEVNPFESGILVDNRIFTEGDAYDQQFVNMGAAGAERYLARIESMIRKYAILESPNEVDVSSPEKIRLLDAFILQLVELSPVPIVGYNISTGNPPDMRWVELLKSSCYALWRTGGRIGLHEYGYPPDGVNNQIGYRCLRYRDFYRRLSALTYVPPIIITEFGPVDDGRGHGWRHFFDGNRATFRDQCKLYSHYIGQDAYVEAACVFTAGPEAQWASFEFDAEEARWLASQYEAHATFEERLGQYAQKFVRPLNPDAALYKHGKALWLAPLMVQGDLRVPISDEFYFENVVSQVWYSPRANMQTIVYCIIGQWGNVRQFDRAN